MARRALPALLALIALLADLSGDHGVALGFVLAAIPAAFALALECYGDTLEARCGGLVLLVLSAALRSPAVVGGVPRLAISAIVLCLLLYAGALLAALFASPQPVTVPAEEPQQQRLAA